MSKKVLVIVGNDHWGRKAADLAIKFPNTIVTYDTSTTSKRVLKLLCKGILSPLVIFKMATAELLRNNYKKHPLSEIKSNSDVLDICSANKIENIILFRAGLIISKEILKEDLNFLNIHCAKIPDFGGLASIARALESESYQQSATLHAVTSRIDEGEIIDTLDFTLDPKLSYRSNEDIAYGTGLALLDSTLKKMTEHQTE